MGGGGGGGGCYLRSGIRTPADQKDPFSNYLEIFIFGETESEMFLNALS